MGLGYSTTENVQGEGVEKIRIVYNGILETVQKEQYHQEVKKHIISEYLSRIRSLAIAETLIEEMYPNGHDMLIVAGVFGPVGTVDSSKDIFVYVKIKAMDGKVESTIKTIQVEPFKNLEDEVSISKGTDIINVDENYVAKKPRRKKGRNPMNR